MMEELEKSLYQKALALLARRDHGVWELRTKLSVHQGSEAYVDAIIDQFIAKGYLSDARFCASFITFRKNRGFGPLWIQSALSSKKISKETIQLALREAEVDWNAIAKEVRRKKYGAVLPKDEKTRYKQKAFLKTRGFSGSHIQSLYKDDEDIG